MERRDFLKSGVSAGFLIALPLLAVSCEKEGGDKDNNGGGPGPDEGIIIDLNSSEHATLKNSGSFKYIDGIIIANTGSGFIALSSVCTHQACTISYLSSNNTFPCPCHNSVFSSEGLVLSGPAPSPVKKYNVSREGDILTITE